MFEIVQNTSRCGGIDGRSLLHKDTPKREKNNQK